MFELFQGQIGTIRSTRNSACLRAKCFLNSCLLSERIHEQTDDVIMPTADHGVATQYDRLLASSRRLFDRPSVCL